MATLKFSLEVQGQPDDRFQTLEFSLEEGLSRCYRAEIHAASENGELGYDDLVGKTATLTVSGEDFSVSHHGLISAFTMLPDQSKEFGHESYPYTLILEPRLRLLEFSGQGRIFQKRKADEIVKAVLEGHGLSGDDLRFELRQALREREYTVQYNESDLNFVSRLMEEEGIYYFFDHEGDKETVVFADHAVAVRPVPHTPTLVYEPEAGLNHMAEDHIIAMRREQRLVTKSARVKDYNERTPRTSILAVSEGAQGRGEQYEFAPNAPDPGAAARWAGAASDGQQALRTLLIGRGVARALRPGYRFELEDGEHSPFAGKYTVVTVAHKGDQREGFKADTQAMNYVCEFSCIPAATVFRPARVSRRAKVPGVLLARVDGPEGDYAHLDEEGRYHAKLPFDLSDAGKGQASLPIRLNQPYAGPGYGTHFPLHNGNDLVLAFLNGDVDRPIALGAIPNPANASPVTSRNKSESVIKTASGHVFRMDDFKDKTVVDLVTAGKHKLALNDDKDHQEIRLETTGKNEAVLDDKNKNIRFSTPEGGHLVKLDSEGHLLTLQTKYGHQITLHDDQKSIVLQTHKGHTLKIDDDKKLIAIQDGDGKHSIQIDIGGSKVSITTEGDMEFSAKGSLNVQAKEINLEAKQGAVNIKAMKDVALDGMNVSAKAKQNVNLEGSVAANVKGLNVKVEAQVNLDLKGGVQTKVSGTMANLEGSAMTQVKGAIVMIN